MKTIFLLAVTLFIFINIKAQPDSAHCVKEINEAIWKPFVAHLISGNNKAFRALHSKRITRVLIDDNILQDYEKYFPLNKRNDTTSQYPGVRRLFELRFDKRICNGNKAWETGFYKGTVMEPGKEERSYYGRFFVVLEKEEGAWKIIVDADTGKEAVAENFNMATPLE